MTKRSLFKKIGNRNLFYYLKANEKQGYSSFALLNGRNDEGANNTANPVFKANLKMTFLLYHLAECHFKQKKCDNRVLFIFPSAKQPVLQRLLSSLYTTATSGEHCV